MYSRQRRPRILAVGATMLVFAVAIPVSANPIMKFVSIANSSENFLVVGDSSINNVGTVAFLGRELNAQAGVFTGNGGALREVHAGNGASISGSSLVSVKDGGRILVVDPNGLVTEVLDICDEEQRSEPGCPARKMLLIQLLDATSRTQSHSTKTACSCLPLGWALAVSCAS